MKKYLRFIQAGLFLAAAGFIMAGSYSTKVAHGDDACPNLFWHSENASNAFHFSFFQNTALSSDPSYDWGWGAIEEYWQSDNVSINVADPASVPTGVQKGLPPGISVGNRTLNYPTLAMNNDGLSPSVDSYIQADSQKGFPPLNRYAFAGTPTAQGEWMFNLTASKSAGCSRTETFDIKVVAPADNGNSNTQSYIAPNIPAAPASQNGLISFVKTIFYNAPASGGDQNLKDMEAWGKKGDKFLISGDYGGSLEGLPLNSQGYSGGGGLWAIAQDGSKIVERQAGPDAGSGTNVIYQHGHRMTSGAINYEWKNGGFVMDNAGWGSCLQGFTATTYCTKQGPGPQKTVYYKQGADGYPVIGGTSPLNGYSGTLALGNNRIIYHGELTSLPSFKDLGPADPSVIGIMSFGNNIVDTTYEVYAVDSEGNALDTGLNLLDPGYKYNNYAWDWSAGWPPKLGIWEVKLGNDFHPVEAKVKVFKLSSSGKVVLERTMKAPLNPGIMNGGSLNSFGLWGNYLVTADFAPQDSSGTFIDSNGNSWVRTPLYVWKADQKVDTIFLPLSGIGYNTRAFAISKDGYVLVNASWWSPLQDLVYLYKLKLTPTVTITPPPPPPTTCQDPKADNYKVSLPCHYASSGSPTGSTDNGKCTATLTFNKSSVAYGGSVTETWEIDGADLGETYADCGAGESQISAGPNSYTMTNLTNSFTCTIYGKIGGVKGCSATAGVSVGAKPTRSTSLQ